MLRKFFALTALILGVSLQTSPTPLRVLDLETTGLTPVPFPAGMLPLKSPIQADFNGDGLPERLELANGRLAIFSSKEPAWQSPAGWKVIQAEITDLNQDGTPEATLLVWRPFRPWPVDQWLPYGGRIDGFHDNQGNSCHIILVGWRGNAYSELWAGSALAEPVKSFTAADLNRDDAQELVTLEGNYTDFPSKPARALKVWEWNGFGFSVVSAVEGTFDKLVLVQSNAGHILIVVP
jgi:hypothetical protein